ncbi:MAG: hypothetical protein RIK87_21265 [Fuerstiella sp.]
MNLKHLRTIVLSSFALSLSMSALPADDGWRASRRPRLASMNGLTQTPERLSGDAAVSISAPVQTESCPAAEPSVGPEARRGAEKAGSCGVRTPVPTQPVGSKRPTTGPLPLSRTRENTAAADSGKPIVTAPPLNTVRPVSFSLSAPERIGDAPDFNSSQSPFLGIRPENLISESCPPVPPVPAQDLFGTAKSPPSAVDQAISEAAAAGSVRSPGSFMNELQSLVGGELTPRPEGTYLQDLNRLLGSKCDWVMTNNTVVDLGPDESVTATAGETYLNDLQQLLNGTDVPAHSGHRALQGRPSLAQSAYRTSYRPSGVAAPQPSDYYEFPETAESKCEETGGGTVAELFQPLSSIDVNGVSTAPPEVPNGAQDDARRLQLPENQACQYMDIDFPGCYFTQGYGFRRAPRNTYCFRNNPLYFEDPNLERCGRSKGCLTTVHSALHFTSMAALSPYLMTVDPPNSCVRALPDCPTCHEFGSDAYLPEWSWKAAAVEAAAVTGMIFIIP